MLEAYSTKKLHVLFIAQECRILDFEMLLHRQFSSPPSVLEYTSLAPQRVVIVYLTLIQANNTYLDYTGQHQEVY